MSFATSSSRLFCPFCAASSRSFVLPSSIAVFSPSAEACCQLSNAKKAYSLQFRDLVLQTGLPRLAGGQVRLDLLELGLGRRSIGGSLTSAVLGTLRTHSLELLEVALQIRF